MFKQCWMWHGCPVQVFQKPTEIYWGIPKQPSLGFVKNNLRNKLSIEQQLSWWKCIVDDSGQRWITTLLIGYKKGNRNNSSNWHSDRSSATKVCKRASLNAQHVKSQRRSALAAEDHIMCQSYQLRTGNWGWNSQRITKIWQQKNRVWWLSKQHENRDPACLLSMVQMVV